MSLDENFIQAVGYGLWVGALVSLVAAMVSFTILYALLSLHVKRSAFMPLWILGFSIPLFIPYTLMALVLFLWFYPSGFIGSILPSLMGSTLALVLAYSIKTGAFLTIVGIPTLVSTKLNAWAQYRLYNGSLFGFFIHIIIPKLWTSMIIGMYVIHAYVLAAYEIPYLIGSRQNPMPAIIIHDTLNKLALDSAQKAYEMSGWLIGVMLLLAPIYFGIYRFVLKRLKP
jgi:ABC-type spermidine/putrescine transport system permease subunit I